METNCAYWNDNESGVEDTHPCMECSLCHTAMADARHDTAAVLAEEDGCHAPISPPTFCDFWAKELIADGTSGTMCAACSMCEVARLGVDGLTVSEAEISALALALETATTTPRGLLQ